MFVVVQPAVQVGRADRFRDDDDAGRRALARPRDGSALKQVDQAVAEQARVNTEVGAAGEEAHDRLGHRADPKLQRRAVRDQRDNVLGDLMLDRARLRSVDLLTWTRTASAGSALSGTNSSDT